LTSSLAAGGGRWKYGSESQLEELSEFAGSFDFSSSDAHSAWEETQLRRESANMVNASSIPLKISATAVEERERAGRGECSETDDRLQSKALAIVRL
jgi:hypothetical protein